MSSHPSEYEEPDRQHRGNPSKYHEIDHTVLLAQLKIAKILNIADNMKEGLALSLDLAIETSGMDCGGIILFDDASATLDFKLSLHKGLSREFVENTLIRMNDSWKTRLILNDQPFYINRQGLADPPGEIEDDENLHALGVFPITYKTNVIGCLYVGSHTFDAIPDVSCILLEIIAIQIGNVVIRSKSDSALRESEDRYRIAIEHSIDGIAMSEEGRYFFVNRAYLKMFGYEKADEIVGKEIEVTVHPEDKKRVRHIYDLRRQGKNAPEMYEFKGIRKDGAHIYIEITATKITYKGRFVILAFFRDITEKKEAAEDLKKQEQSLRESESKFRSLFDASPQAIALTSFETGEVIDVNNKYCESSGYAKEEVIGKKPRNLHYFHKKTETGGLPDCGNPAGSMGWKRIFV